MGIGEKFENAKDQIVGKAKDAFGDATDNERLQTEGKAQQFDGEVGQKVEQGKDSLRDASDDAKAKINDVVDDIKN